MNTETLTTFLGWCTLINAAILLFVALVIVTFRSTIAGLHAAMFGLDEARVSQQYFAYLANYKIALLIFNLTPYVALRLMAG